jgi:hypothetical protein
MKSVGDYLGNRDCETCQIFVCPKDCFNRLGVMEMEFCGMGE